MNSHKTFACNVRVFIWQCLKFTSTFSKDWLGCVFTWDKVKDNLFISCPLSPSKWRKFKFVLIHTSSLNVLPRFGVGPILSKLSWSSRRPDRRRCIQTDPVQRKKYIKWNGGSNMELCSKRKWSLTSAQVVSFCVFDKPPEIKQHVHGIILCRFDYWP